jgi:hypothetical protein
MAKRKSKGLGDTIEKITEATGIKKAVELFSEITGIDCGCDERKELLNNLISYRKKVNCLNESDYNYLKELFENNTNTLTPIQQFKLMDIYKNVFEVQLEQTSCDSCWRTTIAELRKVYDVYGKQE